MTKTRLCLLAALICSAAFNLTMIDWGLPTPQRGLYLFGPDMPWTGQQLAEYDPVAVGIAQGSAFPDSASPDGTSPANAAADSSADTSGGPGTASSSDLRSAHLREIDAVEADLRGADVDTNPIDLAYGPVVINQTEVQRAEIIRRYRLFTHQPDEMITFMALARMRPGENDFDPHLYQYGGLWLYGVGGMLKLAALPQVGLVTLTPDKAFYYDHPEQFGRLYLVARAYTLLWCAAGVWAVFSLGRRLAGGSPSGGLCAAACFTLMPVVLTMSHEAKPHLPAAALALAAVAVAARFTDTGKIRYALLAAAACGASAGMVLSGAAALVILPVMVLCRRGGWFDRGMALFVGLIVAGGVYAATNPYVVVHLLQDRQALRSNLGNSTAMYAIAPSFESFRHAGVLLAEAATPVLGVAGVLGWIILPLVTRRRTARVRRRAALADGSDHMHPNDIARWQPASSDAPAVRRVRRRAIAPASLMLLAAGGVVAVQFALLAQGKPYEYARFAILPSAALALGAVAIAARCRPALLRGVLYIALPAAAAWFYSGQYVHALLADRGPDNTRLQAARYIERLNLRAGSIVRIDNQPAPYNIPPLDLWRWRLTLARPNDTVDADLIVRPVDLPVEDDAPTPPGFTRITFTANLAPAPITWASKPIEVLVREHNGQK